MKYRIHASLQCASFQCEKNKQVFNSVHHIFNVYVNSHTQAGQIVRKFKKMNSIYSYIDESVYKTNQFFRAILQSKEERKDCLYPIHIKNNLF